MCIEEISMLYSEIQISLLFRQRLKLQIMICSLTSYLLIFFSSFSCLFLGW